MQDAGNHDQVGILQPLWRLLDDILAVAQNRIELFQAEAQEEKLKFVQILLLASAIVILTTLCLTLAIFAAIIALGENYQVATLLIFAAICAGAAAFAGRALRRQLNKKVFGSFAEEFRKDRQCIPRP